MFNFFADIENKQNSHYIIDGTDYNHIKNVLRMEIGDTCLISCDGKSDLCRIDAFLDDTVSFEIIEEDYTDTELPVKIYLFQGLPKGDKMEYIIQKCVELGVYGIVPVEMKHCIVKLDDKKAKSKQLRWQSIAESAAKQSKRNIIPEVLDVSSFDKALDFAKTLDLILVPYENKEGMRATAEALSQLENVQSIGIFIGPEGGFEKAEIEKALQNNAKIISLGKRILRTETAAVTAVGMCMLHTEMFEGNNK
ncbi:MAG: 16S rRNA (uracil(1498)-N(3))-methyltransferase [Ruminococcaceae bacterium]|nr:16S rRNA (uracil(1498)-N(3))-methyltransferase [Oscillospiraceae bacterium]